MNYEDMTNEEIKKQLEWSDTHEFSYGYSMWAFEEIERLKTNLEVANEDLTRIAQLLNLEEGCTIYDIEDKIERLNNKLSLIKGIIRTPRKLDKSLAYAMVKTQIENVLGSDKE